VESLQLIVAPIDDVVVVVCDDGARGSRHGRRLIARANAHIAPNLSRRR
jgi:hypothetical protein